ncbi:mannose-ethanolamine phosphotransferase gpi13 [Tulasnella sp. 418]|nr:mannose-ethanolamine phosphotransferase gpi13 [Tulasnella sp. 418]
MISPWVRKLSPYTLATVLLGWVFLMHIIGLLLFTRGFLLTRLSLDTKTSCDPTASTCTLPPTHKKAVFLIIDSLRFDFISPNPPQPADSYYHNVLTLPAELTALQPTQSFIFNAHSDPPTATLQRIKGITTGSLPTFIDVGSNFGGSAITEDSLIHQLVRNEKKVFFMGDDTWMTVYPDSFNKSFPFPSFNVEDLHTVDNGVIDHMFPLIKAGGWDFLIGHFLGVDHVGHRVGPSNPVMQTKLKQMDDVLRRVVSEIDDETLLVVIGDHGMDAKGDHGGDGLLETSSAMWIYSKTVPLSVGTFSQTFPNFKLPSTVFPGSVEPHRAVQQIDLVPTISLLLGLPIPFNNLGTIIPELFVRRDYQDVLLNKAMRINGHQIRNYLKGYRASPSGDELHGVWDDLNSAWEAANVHLEGEIEYEALHAFTRSSLESCRALWAQFNVVLMYTGLVVFALSVPTAWAVYLAVDSAWTSWEAVARSVLDKAFVGALYGAPIGLISTVILPSLASSFTILQATLVFTVLLSNGNVLKTHTPRIPYLRQMTFSNTWIPIIILALHALSYTSNSFLMWEDRILQFFLLTLLSPNLFTFASSPVGRFRVRILGYTILVAVALRLMSISTVCREEQHPFCHVTFYSSSSVPTSPTVAVIAAPLGAFFLPKIARYFLSISSSDSGVAPFFLEKLWRSALIGGSVYWLIERLEVWEGLQPGRIPLLQLIRTMVARVVLVSTAMGGSLFWWYSPLCIQMKKEEVGSGGKQRVSVIGFANAYGSSYLLFVALVFALLFMVTQLSGQVVLVLSLIALLSYLEVVDSQRDSAGMKEAFTTADVQSSNAQLVIKPQKQTFSTPTFISLLSLLLFYTTGHQAVLSTIQWKTAFVGFPVLTYPWSPILVILNTFGPIALVALATPLFAFWNVSPPSPNSPSSNQSESLLWSDIVKNALGVSLYHSTLTFGTALSAALLRRHLMVWKVFAPRYMLGGVSLVVVDLALILGVGVGAKRVSQKVERMFGKRRSM